MRDIVAPYVRTGAWFSHPEAVLLTLAASPVLEEREFAVQHIIKLRGTQDKGETGLARPLFSTLMLLSW